MGKSIEQLGLKAEALPQVAPDAIPDEFGPASPPFYPGQYRFKLPPNLTQCWEKIEVKVNDQGVVDRNGTKTAERVSLVLDSADPLVIEAPADFAGQAFNTTRITNVERNRARKNEPPVYVSDLTYLLRALGSTNPVPKNNAETYAEVCKFAGHSFGATVEYQASCNPNRDAQVATFREDGTFELSPLTNDEGVPQKGCGNRYYMGDWPKDQDGNYLDRRVCECGASLRAFNQIRTFTP